MPPIDVLGASDATNPIVGAAVEGTGTDLNAGILGNTSDGSKVNPNINVLPGVAGGLISQPYSDVYFRIWVVPSLLAPQSPELNTDIPFQLWQAYPEPNTLTSIGGTGQTGLTIDLSPPELWSMLEERTVNIQVTPSAPLEIVATYIFNFTMGVGTLIFRTIIVDWIRFIPEQPVKEVWSWLTDVIGSRDGGEQRIGLRDQARRSIDENFLLDDNTDRRREYDRWYRQMSSDVVVPFYQYDTVITQTSGIGATQIFFDRDKTDVRDGELVIIFRELDEVSFPLQLITVNASGATVLALTREVKQGDRIAPAFRAQLDNRTGPRMTSVSGSLNLKATVSEFRSSFARPGSTAVIDVFDSLPVLERRPMVRGDVPETFDGGLTIIDNETGVIDRSSSWLHSVVSGLRQWSFNRKTVVNDMDYWRDFLDLVDGSRVPFLFSTYREDQVLASIPTAGSTQISFEGTGYAINYFPYDTYTRFRFELEDGTFIYRTATAATVQPDGTTQVALGVGLPPGAEWGVGFKVQYLNRTRIVGDQAQFNHFAVYSTIQLALKVTDD